jgi:hypothetical protein
MPTTICARLTTRKQITQFSRCLLLDQPLFYRLIVLCINILTYVSNAMIYLTTEMITVQPAFEDGTDRRFLNVGKPLYDAGEIPRRTYTIRK